MSGGGNVFSSIGNAVANVVNNLGKSFESGGQSIKALARGDFGEATAKAINSAANSAGFNDIVKPYSPQSRGSVQAPTAQGGPQTEGGTPTAYASSQAKQAAGSAAALSGSQQAVNQSAGSGTMLTGTEGVDPQKLELGKQTLLGG